MQAMGPEAAVLSARLVELRATYVDWDAELPHDGALWAEAAILAGERDAREPETVAPELGLWARMRARLGRREARRPEPEPEGTGASLAYLPLRVDLRR
jgi:hypothetical protein